MSSENIIVIRAKSTNLPPKTYAIRADANKQTLTCFAAGPFPQGLEFCTDIKEREGSG
jgi:hypothetical protein